jgi:hypothetical protein
LNQPNILKPLENFTAVLSPSMILGATSPAYRTGDPCGLLAAKYAGISYTKFLFPTQEFLAQKPTECCMRPMRV